MFSRGPPLSSGRWRNRRRRMDAGNDDLRQLAVGQFSRAGVREAGTALTWLHRVPGSAGCSDGPFAPAPQSSRNATTTGNRAARNAGRSPPTNPMATAYTMPRTRSAGVTANANPTWLKLCQLIVDVS